MLLAYAPAFIFAGLKDLLDLVMIGSLPGIGTAVTFCLTVLILLSLVLFTGSSGRQRGLVRKGMILMAAAVTEGFFFGLNLLPLETLTVYALYRMDKKRRQEALRSEKDDEIAPVYS
jgi:hypothetical protein